MNDIRDRIDNKIGEAVLSNNILRLPSHFPHQIMQKILQVKIERAKTVATFQSALFGIFCCSFVIAFLLLWSELYSLKNFFEFFAASSIFRAQSGSLVVLSLLVLSALAALDHFISRQEV